MFLFGQTLTKVINQQEAAYLGQQVKQAILFKSRDLGEGQDR